MLVQIVAYNRGHLMSDQDVTLHGFSPEIQEPIAEPRLLRRFHLVLDNERGGLGFVEDI